MSNPILWFPSRQRIQAANISAFMRQVSEDSTIEISDYDSLYRWSIKQPESFWNSVWDFSGLVAETRGECTVENIDSFAKVRWFPHARLNFAENLLRYRGSEKAILFCREDGLQSSLSYQQLYQQVSRLVLAFRDMGVVSGDRVAGYLPNIPEAVIAMLAATSIGAIWSSCSPEFGAEALVDRFGQIKPKVLLCVDYYLYNGRQYKTADCVKALLSAVPDIEHVITVRHEDKECVSKPNGDWFHVLVERYSPDLIRFEQFPFDHPLYILYSSGTTGVPKCIVHGAGGTLIQHYKEHQLIADVHPGDRLFYFTTCGWMMWNWLVSGLASGATLVLYDGCPVYPKKSVLIDLIDRFGIDIFGVSAGFIDSLRKANLDYSQTHALTTLKTILSTGSPLLPENFDYIYQKLKSDVCLSSISGGTDIVSCFVAGPPVVPVRRGEIQCCGLGMSVDVFDEQGVSIGDEKGELVCTQPFPSMPVAFWNDAKREKYHAAYFSRFDNVWCHGDFAEITDKGGVIIYGRSDSVLNPGGVRIGSAEIYRQTGQIAEILDSVVIAQEWAGDVRIILFVRLSIGSELNEALIDRINRQIRENASPRHQPAKIIQVADIPYTKSGKLVESAVRNIVHGRKVENISTLVNPESLQNFENIAELNS